MIIRRYFQNWHICKYAKSSQKWYIGLLKLLLIFIYFWTNIIYDFETGLLLANSYNAIQIVVDYWTKKSHYILYDMDDNSKTIEATIILLLNHIWKLYGLSLLLTIDEVLQFILRVLKNIWKVFSILVNLSTYFYLEIEKQIEIANPKLTRYFCILLSINNIIYLLNY